MLNEGHSPLLPMTSTSTSNFNKCQKNWCFTLNNYTEEQYETLLNVDCTYIIIGKEIAPETGTPHLQGFISFNKTKRLAACRKIMQAHWTACTGTAEQNRNYCLKNDNYEERGELPMNRKQQAEYQKDRYAAVIQSAIDGTAKEEFPREYLVYHNAIEKIHAKHKKPKHRHDIKIYVYWGQTRTGKSRLADELAGENAYRKSPRSIFWQGYQGEENVIIDEFRGGIDISHMLRWFDRYPVTVEIKGSSTPLCAINFWITSNIHPREWYPDLDSETMAALMERMEIKEFKKLK
uniref:hypothetical protein n=1 Tax=Flavobacterium sp. TaxID=239 RepID=UPI004047F3F8